MNHIEIAVANADSIAVGHLIHTIEATGVLTMEVVRNVEFASESPRPGDVIRMGVSISDTDDLYVPVIGGIQILVDVLCRIDNDAFVTIVDQVRDTSRPRANDLHDTVAFFDVVLAVDTTPAIHPVVDGFGIVPVLAEELCSTTGCDTSNADEDDLSVLWKFVEVPLEGRVIVFEEFIVDRQIRASGELPLLEVLLAPYIENEWVRFLILYALCDLCRTVSSIAHCIHNYTLEVLKSPGSECQL
ncbi:hypothetical protein C447_00760 [Halococcus hamelinensis 100A6]|uniref:Uncharacterized protein n=1 Tax=Halococcus hamelinensis 100A6 TaxID=1132509 RepID=M0M8M5_9EURY|nr:hypothetical protein C447_00760 [Halococcus hamelinensis 100A6]